MCLFCLFLSDVINFLQDGHLKSWLYLVSCLCIKSTCFSIRSFLLLIHEGETLLAVLPLCVLIDPMQWIYNFIMFFLRLTLQISWHSSPSSHVTVCSQAISTTPRDKPYSLSAFSPAVWRFNTSSSTSLAALYSTECGLFLTETENLFDQMSCVGVWRVYWDFTLLLWWFTTLSFPCTH